VTRATPLLDVLLAAGARLAECDGWQQAADFGDPIAEQEAAAGVSDRSARGLLRVHGRDAAALLHGLVTNDIEALAPGEAGYGLVLTPKGRPVADLRVLRESDDSFLLVCEPAAHDALAATVRRYRLASKATIEDARGQVALIAELGGADSVGGQMARVPGPLGPELVGTVADVRAAWQAQLAAGARAIGATAFDALRVAAGAPRHGVDFDETTLPAEAGVVEQAVSFTKGCFIGQEPVARLRYRGQANRALRRLAFVGGVPALPARLVRDGREVGRVTSVAVLSGGRAVGIGYVRREVPDDAELAVEGEAGARLAATLVSSRP